MPLPDDPAATWELVDADVRAVFGEPFEGQLVMPAPFEPDLLIASETTVAVPWQWLGTHVRPFLDIPATGLEVEVLGVSLLRDDGDGVVIHRVVDWLTLYQRLGVVIGSRTTLDRSELLEESRRRPPDDEG